MSVIPALEATDLVVTYGGNVALSVWRLEVRSGELIGVVGANGAGKSTLVNAMLGWSRGTPKVSGVVKLDGRDLSGCPTHERIREGLLLIPEGKLVFGTMTVQENLTSVGYGGSEQGRRSYSLDETYELFPRLHERRGHLG